jgi:dihydrofolate reductase/thymidylate synthase
MILNYRQSLTMIDKPFEIVAAVCLNNGLGYQGSIPWKCPADRKFFRELTTKTVNPGKVNAVIMGKKTWQSLSGALSGRLNIVITRDPNISTDGIYVFHSLFEAHHWLNGQYNVERRFIIGGGQLYQEAIKGNWSKTLYLTRIAENHTCDVFFPEMPSYYHQTEGQKLGEGVILNVYHNRYGRHYEEKYLRHMRRLLDQPMTEGRNGGVHSSFQWHYKIDLADGLPLFSTRKAFIKGIIKELLFFIHGKTNSKELESQNITIWKGNTTREFLDSRGLYHYEEGDMGPMYGWVWRHYGDTYRGMRHQHQGYDQLRDVVDKLLHDQNSRRILMTAYDPSKVPQSVLAPCHSIVIQFNVREESGGKFLDMFTYQRSADMFLGVYFNIPSNAILLTILAHAVGMIPGRLYIQFGDCHVYASHREAVMQQLKRTPSDELPTLHITSISPYQDNQTADTDKTVQWIESLTYDDFKITGYHPQEAIKAQMVV